MLERRRHRREAVLKVATVHTKGHSLGIACTIRNWSLHGACLQASNGLRLPSSCELVLEGIRDALRVNVIWRAGNKLGVAFRDGTASPGSSPQAA
jgi:hypothetical protein